MKTYLTILLSIFFTFPAKAYPALREQIQHIIGNAEAEIGVAVIINGKDTLTFNNEAHYPLMSVMKYHQALAVAHYLDQRDLPLSTHIRIEKQDLRPDTYSPLRDKYPNGGISLSIGELLTYTLQLSDNNACDILFEYIGGTASANQYLQTLGIEGFSISATENDMHQNPERCYENWSTPLSAARFMDSLIAGTLPIDTAYTRFIQETLLSCQTGKTRLPSPLQGTDARIGHKTGTSDQNEKGEWIGINDVGFILLPDGKRYTVAVLVKHSKLSYEETERIIADISTLIYQAYLTTNQFYPVINKNIRLRNENLKR